MKIGCQPKSTDPKRSIALPVLAETQSVPGEMRVSRTARWRAAALITLNLLMALHVAQWLMTGSTISPIEPSEAMYTITRGAINAGVVFFVLAILATLIFGRFVCGWGCHVVALQDLCGWLLKKMGIRPRPFRSRLLMLVPLLAALYMFVWPAVARYLTTPPGEPLIPQFTNHLVTTDFWATFPPVWVAIPFLFVCGFITVYFLGQKGFCTYGCPYGGFFAIADRAAPGKIRVTDACNQCGHCTATCTSNVLVHAEVKQYGMVVDPGCMKCMDCVSVCPNDALYFGFGKPSAAVRHTTSRSYTLTWPEEIAAAVIFSVSLFAVWDVYQLVPMLMALGIAPITTFVVLRSWRFLRNRDVTLHKFSLRSSGKITAAGWIFIAFAASWTGLIIHSGWVRYHESAGTKAFESVGLPDELALAQRDPANWLSSADKRQITEGKTQFQEAFDTGLFTNVPALSKLAWLEFLSGDAERSVITLEAAARHQTGQARAISLYYRGAILNQLGRHHEALESLDLALSESPDLVLAREQRGEALWRLGRRSEAINEWTEAVQANPALPLTQSFLSGAAAAEGRQQAAAELAKRAEDFIPQDGRFYWMLGLRLKNAGMNTTAERYFQQAIRLDPSLKAKQLELLKPV